MLPIFDDETKPERKNQELLYVLDLEAKTKDEEGTLQLLDREK